MQKFTMKDIKSMKFFFCHSREACPRPDRGAGIQFFRSMGVSPMFFCRVPFIFIRVIRVPLFFDQKKQPV